MSRSPWPPGTSSSFVDGLISRMTSCPEVMVVLSYRVKKRIRSGEGAEFACTYSGTDPTEDLLVLLADVMIAYERVRVEALAPMVENPAGAPAVYSAISVELLPMESMLMDMILRAARINGLAWGREEEP
jgi:hypothetical protein